MATKIDYKRLWRKANRQLNTLNSKILKSSEIIKIQGEMIKDLTKKKSRLEKYEK